MQGSTVDAPEKPKRKVGRPVGSGHKRLAVIDSIHRNFGGTDEFWGKICQASLDGDAPSTALLVNRIHPAMKPQSAAVQLDAESDNPKDFVSAVLKSISKGELGPDEGASLLSAVSSGSQILKLEEPESKINQLMERK
jgi:hypothetical protein